MTVTNLTCTVVMLMLLVTSKGCGGGGRGCGRTSRPGTRRGVDRGRALSKPWRQGCRRGDHTRHLTHLTSLESGVVQEGAWGAIPAITFLRVTRVENRLGRTLGLIRLVRWDVLLVMGWSNRSNYPYISGDPKNMHPSNMSITLEQVTQTALKFVCINFVLTIFYISICFS